jgi:thiosulfate dehydrogenase
MKPNQRLVRVGLAALCTAALLTGFDSAKTTDRTRDGWRKEQDQVIERGNQLFHDGAALGTNGVACAMCHPDGANTHPETYPKYQSQLKRVVTLPQMVNWCIVNPLQGKELALDSPEMVALVAYMTSVRGEKTLAPGKL